MKPAAGQTEPEGGGKHTRVSNRTAVPLDTPAPAAQPPATKGKRQTAPTTTNTTKQPPTYWDTPSSRLSLVDFPLAQAFLGTPRLAAISGGVLREAAAGRKEKTLPTAIAGAIAPETRSAHERWLARLAAMPPELRNIPEDRALVELFGAEAAERKWAATTLAKEAGSLCGALRRLRAYRPDAPWDLDLSSAGLWRDVARQAGKEAAQADKRKPRPATAEEAAAAIDKATANGDGRLAATLAIIWSTACRPGCALQLRRSDVELVGPKLRVTFRKGKRQELRADALPVFTFLRPEWGPVVSAVLAPLAPNDFLWSFPSRSARLKGPKLLTEALRSIAADLVVRSLRSGALRRMLAAGVSEELLCKFSGHSSVKTLREYCGLPPEGGQLEKEMRTAAAHLL